MLSVIFDSDSFFYAVSDINNNLKIAVKFQLEEDPITEIPRIIAEESLADHYYSAVNIFSRSSKFIFVPNAEYSYGTESTFIQNSFELTNDEVNVDLCSSERLNIIHAYPKAFQKAFHSLKSENNFRHVSLAFIEGISEDGIHISVTPYGTTILVRNNSLFVYYNQFQTETAEDSLYFVMLAFDQLGLDPERDKLFLDGTTDRKDELKELLKNYVVNISTAPGKFSNMSDSEDLMDLYLASICE
ncbi:DUF3822 family protein [Portibacter lacus]|uniref:DUF3822 family protein n=1 Tax=Portibacter lacus TaxID=1099794 RepID=A0AA37WC86_9BACT|nr:DUF3822 family protein [Portibacter lacus]GLR16271.1 hypothetical protein GCM10007940_08860 [Portibacter lacus]